MQGVVEVGDGSPGLFTGETVRILAPVQDQYEFELIVTAAGVQSPPDRVLVSIDNVNSVPVLSAGQSRRGRDRRPRSGARRTS